MKSIPELILDLQKKKVEHEKEIELTLAEQDKIKNNLETVQKQGNIHQLMLESNKIVILKDKIVFHKSCVLCLDEIIREIS